MQDAATSLKVYRERGTRGLPLRRFYRQLYREDLFLHSYGKLYRNAGAMTPGATPETADGMSLRKVRRIVEALRAETFRRRPARRTEIPKKSGGTRPLGLPTWSDKLVQETLRVLLEAYHEPRFRDSSHGFRPGRGCHTALARVHSWKAVSWFVEGDVSKCFDRIRHETLLKILGESVQDGRLLRLASGLLRAGYSDRWRCHATQSGTPQGGVISPLLANIYLDRPDAFVEDEPVPHYTRGRERRRNPEHMRLMRAAYKARKKGDWERDRQLKRQARALPSIDPDDPGFRRPRYVRYADDFLLGFIGPKREAEEIKARVGKFLADRLRLELSTAKTSLTHGRTQAARFLGHEVVVSHNDTKLTAGRRSANGRAALLVPQDVVREKRKAFRRRGKVVQLNAMLRESGYAIVSRFQSHWRGFLNYYLLAKNVSKRLPLVYHTMRTSLLKTLAAKHRSSVAKMARKYAATVDTEHGRRRVLQVRVARPGKRDLVATFGGLPMRWRKDVPNSDPPTALVWCRRTELVERPLADVCEMCGSDGHCEVHHVRKLADIDKPGRRAKPAWAKTMIARQRKTLVLCRGCHRDVHRGKHDGPSLSQAPESRVLGNWQARFGGGRLEKCLHRRSLAGRLPYLIDPDGWVDLDCRDPQTGWSRTERFAPNQGTRFVWNSEVGRRSLGVQTFRHQHVCRNHIVWDAVEVAEFSRKHTADVRNGLDEIRLRIDALVKRRDERRDAFAATMKTAMTTDFQPNATREKAVKALQKGASPPRSPSRSCPRAGGPGRCSTWSTS